MMDVVYCLLVLRAYLRFMVKKLTGDNLAWMSIFLFPNLTAGIQAYE